MKKQLASALIAATAMTLAAPAVAEGVYIGGAFGRTSVDIEQGNLGGFTVTADENDTGLKLFVGFDIADQFAIEVGYADFGDSSATISGFGATNKMTFSTSALFVDAVGRVPVGESVRLLGKLGFARTTTDVNDVDNGIFCNCTLNSSMKSTSFKYGLGAEMMVNQALAVRGEYEVITDAGDDATYGESDISMLSIGLTYKF